MNKSIFYILIIFFSVSCSHSEKIEKNYKNRIDQSTLNSIDSLSKIEKYIDNGYWFTCGDDKSNFYSIFEDSLSKNNLLQFYNKNDIGYPFKLNLFKILYNKHKNLRVQLLDEATNDNTIITHVSSCFGIGYQQTYEEDCFLYARKFNPDSIGSVIINKHQYLSYLPKVLTTTKPMKENYQNIKKLIDSMPEALIALSKYKKTIDTLVIQEHLIKYISNSDTNSLVKCFPILDNTISIPGQYLYSPYKKLYGTFIIDFNLHLSNQYRKSISQIVFCYLKNLNAPYPQLDLIINNLITEYYKDKIEEIDKENIIESLQDIYSSFYNSLNLKHYKMHQQELSILEKFLLKEKGNIDESSYFGYRYNYQWLW